MGYVKNLPSGTQTVTFKSYISIGFVLSNVSVTDTPETAGRIWNGSDGNVF